MEHLQTHAEIYQTQSRIHLSPPIYRDRTSKYVQGFKYNYLVKVKIKMYNVSTSILFEWLPREACQSPLCASRILTTFSCHSKALALRIQLGWYFNAHFGSLLKHQNTSRTKTNIFSATRIYICELWMYALSYF